MFQKMFAQFVAYFNTKKFSGFFHLKVKRYSKTMHLFKKAIKKFAFSEVQSLFWYVKKWLKYKHLPYFSLKFYETIT